MASHRIHGSKASMVCFAAALAVLTVGLHCFPQSGAALTPEYTHFKMYKPRVNPSPARKRKSFRVSGTFLSDSYSLSSYSDAWVYVRVYKKYSRNGKTKWKRVRSERVRPTFVGGGYTLTLPYGTQDAAKYKYSTSFKFTKRGRFRTRAFVDIEEGDDGIMWRAQAWSGRRYFNVK